MNLDIGFCCQSLSPTEVPEHEHQEWQISLLSPIAATQVSWHTATGQQQQKLLLGEQIVITPTSQPHGCYWQREAEIICFFLNPKFVLHAIEDNLGKHSTEITEHYGIADPFIQQLGLAFKTEWQLSQNIGKLYLESIATVLAVHLLRNYSTSGSVAQIHQFNLTQPQFQRVIEYIQANLERDLTLSQMAVVAHVSPYYFARSFKNFIGLTPHQYLLKCRIERAKILLRDRNLAIAAIARQVGFQHQSHFTTVFRKFTSTTPSIYRQNI